MTTYATYWDEAEQAVKTIPWVKKATVDATADVLSKVQTFFYNKAFQRLVDRAKSDAMKPKKGDVVKVTAGKTAKGLVGKVVVQIERPYKMGWNSAMLPKFGIATSEEKIEVKAANGKFYENYKDVTWVWAKNCELVEIPDIDLVQVRETAEILGEADFKKVYKAA